MFITDLELIAEPQADLWRLGAPLVWLSPVYGRLEAPVGFVTDLASIPRVFRNLPFTDPNGVSRRPAVLHDYLYSSRLGYRLGKQFADSFLRTALEAEKASKVTAQAFYWAVKLGGSSHWDPLNARKW